MSSNMETTEIVSFENNDGSRILFGQQNANLKAIAQHLDISVASRSGEVTLTGNEERVKFALKALNQFYDLVLKQYPLKPSDIIRGLNILDEQPDVDLSSIFLDNIIISTATRRKVVAKTYAQKLYVDAIRNNDLVFSIGPAGTGKTYLAMAMAVSALLNKECKRIILTRPAVEAGERLGFLPGDLEEKVNPYLRPLYDALYDIVSAEKAKYWMQNNVVEVAPLAFMRGRTLNKSFIILDEAQNTTKEQMKMFLTRMGFGSQAVVTGDVTQVDLPGGQTSGLVHSTRLLENLEGISVCRFSDTDVVRHPLVQRIVKAYETAEGNS